MARVFDCPLVFGGTYWFSESVSEEAVLQFFGLGEDLLYSLPPGVPLSEVPPILEFLFENGAIFFVSGGGLRRNSRVW